MATRQEAEAEEATVELNIAQPEITRGASRQRLLTDDMESPVKAQRNGARRLKAVTEHDVANGGTPDATKPLASKWRGPRVVVAALLALLGAMAAASVAAYVFFGPEPMATVPSTAASPPSDVPMGATSFASGFPCAVAPAGWAGPLRACNDTVAESAASLVDSSSGEAVVLFDAASPAASLSFSITLHVVDNDADAAARAMRALLDTTCADFEVIVVGTPGSPGVNAARAMAVDRAVNLPQDSFTGCVAALGYAACEHTLPAGPGADRPPAVAWIRRLVFVRPSSRSASEPPGSLHGQKAQYRGSLTSACAMAVRGWNLRMAAASVAVVSICVFNSSQTEALNWDRDGFFWPGPDASAGPGPTILDAAQASNSFDTDESAFIAVDVTHLAMAANGSAVGGHAPLRRCDELGPARPMPLPEGLTTMAAAMSVAAMDFIRAAGSGW